MKSGKKAMLFIFLLMPVTVTTLSGLMQRHRSGDAPVWLNLVFYAAVVIFSICFAFIIIQQFADRNRIIERLRAASNSGEEEKQSNDKVNRERVLQNKTGKISHHEKRFRALIENSMDAILLMDSSFKMIYRSPSAVRVTGWTDEDDMTSKPDNFIYKEDIATVGSIVSEALKNPGKPHPVLFRCLHKKGHFVWLQGTLTNMLENEDVQALVFNAHDATQRIEAEEERKLTQENLLYSETRFRALIENSVEGVALTDEFSNIIYRSPGSAKITGELPRTNTLSRTAPEDMQMMKAIHRETISNPGVPVPFQGRFQHAAGHYIWIEGTFTNMLRVNGVHAIVANYRDISERKKSENSLIESEQLYKSLFQNMLHGYAYCKGIFDGEQMTDFTYIAVNNEYENLTGFKNVEGKNVSEVSPTMLASDPEYARILSRVALTGKPEKFEAYVERRDKWFSTSVYSPATGYFVGLLDNVTDQKRAERKNYLSNVELEKKVLLRTEELKKKNEEMEAFSYSVSHDLRAPLRGIIGFTTILEEEYSSKMDAEAKRLTGIIRHNTQKMGRLIDDLLTFSKMGRQQIKKALVDANYMVDQIIRELENKIGQNAIDWNVQSMETVQGDLNTIYQVWVNLLSNAIKYSGRNPHPKIEIHSFRKADQVVFEVKDNGVGFDPAYTDKLFKVFQRLHAANDFDGTGVGLAIVEKIVTRHGGKVWAESEVNKGASFFFSLPA